MKCEHSKDCSREPTFECGYCANSFCDEHLIYFNHSDIDAKFFCHWCCKLFESERPSW